MPWIQVRKYYKTGVTSVKDYISGLVTGLFVGAVAMVYCICKDEFICQEECQDEWQEDVENRTPSAAFYSGSPGGSFE